MNLIQGSLQALLPPKRKLTTGGWISFNAVCCHHRGESKDTKGRGGVMFTGDGFTYHCFNCTFKAGWQPGKTLSKNTKQLFKWLGMPDDELNKLILEALREKDNQTPSEKKFSLELPDVLLPENCLPIVTWIDNGCEDKELLDVIEYIYSRNLTLFDYNWHWSPENGYKDRVIIPFYNQGRVVGWTGRKITPGNPKYLTHTSRGCVFNMDAQTYDRNVVIVTEGQFDAISISGVAIMHNDPNEIQAARINSLAREVIVVPDRDKAGANMIDAALKYGWNVSVPPWGEGIKDVGDAVKAYGKLYTLATILHYKETNRIKIELQKKKLEKLHE